MPGDWTLKDGLRFAAAAAKKCKPKVRRAPFKFRANDDPPKWTDDDIKWLNRLAWTLVLTPLCWEAIEEIWTGAIMVRNNTSTSLAFR